jgi:hypothetical protein
MGIKVRDDRHLRSLTGVAAAKFEILLKAFAKTYTEMQWEAFQAGLAAGTRERRPGGGKKGALPTMRDKLLFVLYYFKVYPTFDVLGTQFNLSRSKANENLYKLAPVLYRTLVALEVMPQREFASPTELLAALKGLNTILIDVTERNHRRPQDESTQREHYSGKKKRHTIKNTIISTLTKTILFVGQTFSGHTHDYTMLKEEFPPEQAWFELLQVLVDLGYQGICTDYAGDEIQIPHKKPRKSKKNPVTTLSPEQKAENQALSKVRIFVENAIGGLKRYNILVHRFRNHKASFEDDVIGIAAGLWNFNLSY